MGKSVRELGESMSAHELTVMWPAYMNARAEMREAEQEKWRDQ
jgi:hypothetical protein